MSKSEYISTREKWPEEVERVRTDADWLKKQVRAQIEEILAKRPLQQPFPEHVLQEMTDLYATELQTKAHKVEPRKLRTTRAELAILGIILRETANDTVHVNMDAITTEATLNTLTVLSKLTEVRAHMKMRGKRIFANAERIEILAAD